MKLEKFTLNLMILSNSFSFLSKIRKTKENVKKNNLTRALEKVSVTLKVAAVQCKITFAEFLFWKLKKFTLNIKILTIDSI